MSGNKNDGKGANDVADTEPFYYPAALSVGYSIRVAHRLRLLELERALEFSGVSVAQWYFLRALWDEDGLTQRELSARVAMKEPTTVLALKGMEKSKLIYRVRDADDLRKVRVYLTEAGHGLRNILLPLVKRVNERATAGIPPQDIRKFQSVLEQITKNLHAAKDLEPVRWGSRAFDTVPCWKLLPTNASAGSGRHAAPPKGVSENIGPSEAKQLEDFQRCAVCFISSKGHPRCPSRA